MKIEDFVTIDPDILHGTPVFKGTRVPVQSLFWHLEKGISIDAFLDDFPSVTREQIVWVLDLSGSMFEPKKSEGAYEIAA